MKETCTINRASHIHSLFIIITITMLHVYANWSQNKQKLFILYAYLKLLLGDSAIFSYICNVEARERNYVAISIMYYSPYDCCP